MRKKEKLSLMEHRVGQRLFGKFQLLTPFNPVVPQRTLCRRDIPSSPQRQPIENVITTHIAL